MTGAQRRIPTAALSFVLVASSVSLPRPAAAQSESAVEDALLRFEEGLGAASLANQTGDDAKWEEARVKFLQAYAVVRRPSLVFNLAYSEERLGRTLDAITHYREYLTFPERPKESDARARIDALLQSVGQLRVHAPLHAEIAVDGTLLPGRAPLDDTVAVTPGTHTVRARLGVQEATTSVAVREGGLVPVELAFERAPSKEPAPPAPSAARVVTVVGLGALSAGAFVAAGVLKAGAGDAARTQSELQAGYADDSCSGVTSERCTQLAAATEDRQRKDAWAGAFLGAGLALAGGAALTYLLWPAPSSEARAASASSAPRPRISVRGSFVAIDSTF